MIESSHVLAELRELAFFYEELHEGLGERIIKEYLDIISTLEQTPQHQFNISNKVRRMLFKKFSCGVFYCINNDTVKIVGIKDMRIHPNKFPKL